MSDDRAAFFALMERAVRIGTLLPGIEDVDVDDPVAIAELKLILAEFNAARAAVEAFPLQAA
jgi:hypothetical protein